MIEIRTRKGLFSYRTKWFYACPDRRDALAPVQYIQSAQLLERPGFLRESFFTIVIDLTQAEEGLFSACRESTRYEIRRAEREGVRFGLEGGRGDFLALYQALSAARGLPQPGPAHLEAFGPSLRITRASSAGRSLAMHSYLVDEEAKRVRLLHSVSPLSREEEPAERSLIGRANRFLHYQDLLFFKRAGLSLYDLGGFAADPEAESLLGVNAFKSSFGGRVIEESNFTSLPLHLYRALRGGLRRRGRPAPAREAVTGGPGGS